MLRGYAFPDYSVARNGLIRDDTTGRLVPTELDADGDTYVRLRKANGRKVRIAVYEVVMPMYGYAESNIVRGALKRAARRDGRSLVAA